MRKMLSELIALLPEAQCQGNGGAVITSITQDSRQVKKGSLFVCLPGSKVDGHDFAEKAVAAGAVALLADRPLTVAGAAVIVVPDVREAMGRIVPFFYDRPTEKLRLLGVTGTNGKTTTTYLLTAILEAAGYRVGLIGTIQSLIGDEKVPAKNTTPDVIELQELLWRMAEAGMDYVVMEVSSHALALNRVAGCEFDTAMFTNMTQDHLDFHKTFDEYAAAKARLFSLVSQGGSKTGKHAVINADDAACAIAEAVHAEKLAFLSDIEGVYKDKDDPSSLISELHVDEAQKLIDDGYVGGGMIPKLKNCIDAIEEGVNRVHILDGRIPHSLLLEIFTNKGIGTAILREDGEKYYNEHE